MREVGESERLIKRGWVRGVGKLIEIKYTVRLQTDSPRAGVIGSQILYSNQGS